MNFPASSPEATLEFKWKNLPLPPSLLVCQVVIFPPLLRATSQRRQTAVTAAQAALGVGAIARELLVSLVHPVMLPGGEGTEVLLKEGIFIIFKRQSPKRISDTFVSKALSQLLQGGFDLVTQSIVSGVRTAKPRRAVALGFPPLPCLLLVAAL